MPGWVGAIRQIVWPYLRPIGLLVFLLSALSPLPATPQQPSTILLVPREELVKAMEEQKQEGYNILATTNGSRFSAGVLLYLVQWAKQVDSTQSALLVHHEDNFRAYLQVAQVESAKAPTFVKLAYKNSQDEIVVYSKVIKRVAEGSQPITSLSILASSRSDFSYKDNLSKPKLKVHNGRRITYRLLDFGNRIVYDQIDGLSGRPLDGILGTLFSIIGEGDAKYAAFAMKDSLQVMYSVAKKGPFTKKPVTTIYPKGDVVNGTKRKDLSQLAEMLKRPVKIEYVDVRWPSSHAETIRVAQDGH